MCHFLKNNSSFWTWQQHVSKKLNWEQQRLKTPHSTLSTFILRISLLFNKASSLIVPLKLLHILCIFFYGTVHFFRELCRVLCWGWLCLSGWPSELRYTLLPLKWVGLCRWPLKAVTLQWQTASAGPPLMSQHCRAPQQQPQYLSIASKCS